MNMARIESHPGLFGNPYMDTKSKTHEANPQKGFVVQINASENFGLKQLTHCALRSSWLKCPAFTSCRTRREKTWMAGPSPAMTDVTDWSLSLRYYTNSQSN